MLTAASPVMLKLGVHSRVLPSVPIFRRHRLRRSAGSRQQPFWDTDPRATLPPVTLLCQLLSPGLRASSPVVPGTQA